MRVLSYDVPECDDGRQIKYVMRSRLGISHRQLSRLKTTDGMSVNGASVHANHVVHTGDKISLRLEEDMERDGSGAQAAIDDMSDGGDAHVPSAALNEQVCAALDERYADTIAMLSPSGKSRTQTELAREIVVYEDDDTLIINKPAHPANWRKRPAGRHHAGKRAVCAIRLKRRLAVSPGQSP